MFDHGDDGITLLRFRPTTGTLGPDSTATTDHDDEPDATTN